MSVIGISANGNPEQKEFIRLMYENNKQIIFCTGNAGTGKTFIATATAIQYVSEEKRYGKQGKIIFTRDPVQVGEPIGFLPGKLDDKLNPFMSCLDDTLESIANQNKSLNKNDLRSRIECTPIAFMRGRNLENTFLIVDEAQNLDMTSLKMVLTRIGKYSKIVLLGSMNQIDKKKMNKGKCDFERAMEALRDLPYVGHIHLIQSERSPICSEIDQLLEDAEKEIKKEEV